MASGWERRLVPPSSPSRPNPNVDMSLFGRPRRGRQPFAAAADSLPPALAGTGGKPGRRTRDHGENEGRDVDGDVLVVDASELTRIKSEALLATPAQLLRRQQEQDCLEQDRRVRVCVRASGLTLDS